MTYAINSRGRVVTQRRVNDEITNLVEIGLTYIAPPARMGSEALRIQRGLLAKQPQRKGLPTLTPTTRWGRLLAWLRGLA